MNEICSKLMRLADISYKSFHAGICPGTENILGVRIPALRAYAKELYAKYGIGALDKIQDDYNEEIMLQGMIIGLEKVFRRDLIESFLPKINNWGVCDVFCSSLKIAKKHKKEMLDLIQNALKSQQAFKQRFGIVMLLSYYTDDTHLPFLFKTFDEIHTEEYYVKMAVAWAVSVCLCKYFEQTVIYLQHCKLDTFTFNKALQKGIESYRVSQEQKQLLRRMKRTKSGE